MQKAAAHDRVLAELRGRLEQGEDPEALRPELEQALEAGRDRRGGHTQWGLLCEQAGLFGLAFREFQLAVRDDRNDPVACFKLAEYFREHGDTRRAAGLLERLLEREPANEQWLTAYVELLQADDAWPRIEQALDRAVASGLPKKTADRLRGRPDKRDGTDEQPEQLPELTPTDADCVRFATLFAGREDVHARQWASPQQGKTGYTPVYEPFTPAVARNHLLGTYTVGVYPIRLDGTATWFALDLDVSRKMLEQARRDHDVAQTLRAQLREQSLWLLKVLKDFGFDPLFENSGYKGRHYWVFLEQPEEAAVLHQFGKMLLTWLQPQLSDGLHLEFFPKQATRTGKGLGNLIKLPLGIHRRTGYRSLLLDENGRPLTQPLERLKEVKRAERATLYAAIDRLKKTVVAAHGGHLDEEQAANETATEEDQLDVPTPPPPDVPLPWTEADFETDRQVAHLLAECPVLAKLKQRVDEFRRLNHDEQTVLIHTLGHLPAGPQAVNYLFARCVDIAPDRYLKSPLRGNPISCPKIRKRIGHITRQVNCNCLFEFAPDRYPTPLLHLLTLPPEEELKQQQHQQVPDKLEELAKRFGVLERKRQEIQKEWELLHDALCQALQQLPNRTLVLEGGAYRLVEKEGVEELVWEPERQQNQASSEGDKMKGPNERLERETVDSNNAPKATLDKQAADAATSERQEELPPFDWNEQNDGPWNPDTETF